MKKEICLLITAVIGSAGLTLGADTNALWNANCASCHGKDGTGNTMMGKKLNVKDYRDSSVQSAFSDAEAARAIKEGVKTNGRETMKPFGGKLSDADIAALVAHIRSFKK